MNAMCGVLNPTHGDILIDGYSIRKDPLTAKTRLGFLPQQVPIYPELTVSEYLTFCAEIRGVEKSKVRVAVEEAMERCGIGHFAKRLIGALSGGYRQRCGIAQAILHNPSLVVLDEPTNGLDPLQILELRALIKEIGADRTVLISSHILSEVEALCDDIKMIDHGRLVFDGSLDEFAGTVEPKSLIAVFGEQPSTALIDALEVIDGTQIISDAKIKVFFNSRSKAPEAIIELSRQQGWDLQEIYFERASLDTAFERFANRESKKQVLHP